MELVFLLSSVVFVDYVTGSQIKLSRIPVNLPTVHRNEFPYSNNFVKIPGERIPGFMRYGPRKRDLKKKRLLRKLGSDYNDKWSSIDPPKETSDDIVLSQNAQKIDLKLTHFFGTLNLTFFDSQNNVVNMSGETRELFRLWLLRHGSCPVTYTWQDLGVLFWPRWIRRGHCDETQGLSCSWPPGMSCVPAESTMVKILRWNCRKKKRKGKKRKTKIDNRVTNEKVDTVERQSKPRGRKRRYRRMKCKWLKVSFPVVDECFCSC